ncbi:MAG: hypothetical protein M3Y55_10370 [Pseudomonadota bacterium]|nr:hypothetical protein [Pseudomonadota bacterium]
MAEGDSNGVAAPPKVKWVERRGRGRLGGSAVALALIQRARFNNRRVLPLDADWKSRTLSIYYPSVDAAGNKTADPASSPATRDLSGFKTWLPAELDASLEDGVSRVLDISGGSSEIDEFMDDLDLPEFCAEAGIGLVSLFMLGPDTEDLSHLMEAVSSGSVRPANLLIAFNEGVMRGGNALEVFGRVKMSDEIKKLVEEGARVMFVQRFPCMTMLREKAEDFTGSRTAKVRTAPGYFRPKFIWRGHGPHISSLNSNVSGSGTVCRE